MKLSLLLDWRLHVLVAVASLISEAIGIIKIPLGPGSLLLLPLFYAFIIGLLVNPHLFSATSKVVPVKLSEAAAPIILLSIMPFIARFGSTIGPAIEQIISAGPALILQELGNLGTMLIAMPFAVLVLKMGREAIGATYSIAREPNIAIISDKYGLKGPEGIGVMGVYVVGTMFGTLWFALMAGYLATLDIFDPRALAMACGVGSGSMVAACSGAIAGALPAMRDELLAFAGASNLLTYATGLYISLFIALPLAERIFKWCSGRRVATSAGAKATVAPDLATPPSAEERPERHLGQTAIVMAVVCVVAWVSNTINGGSLLAALPGMVILYAMTMLGLLITRFAPFYLPGVAWVSLVSIAVTLPWFPGSAWIVAQLQAVSFLAIVTPVLAYAGLALSSREFTMFRQVGWKLIIVSLLVFTGTFIGSAVVAQALL
ncbi:hypothetical protein C8E00_101560 [Chromohalobacter marismortui]|uniref:DUF3100 family protein n=1 Tax=Chromohalobacter marismortui TaxID=42055 RepID=A0A4V3F4G2_9GAMM|nr:MULTISPECIES: DUF3100 domain-containing protein [Chromohalobacter]MCI0511141.1 DUF3100 domain-containing protein [Chromohalobacter sp.]MCI0594557.1 DUF3100 domain-containing protein [Chromohalobacter sp.]TDU25166.1 hypothetical protein C8E00_101560 [Chromohalobacter marismortui]